MSSNPYREQSIGGLAVSDLKPLFLPSALASYAIVGYLLFLLLPTRPDLSTLSLLVSGLLAFLVKDGLRPGLGRSDYMVLALLVVAVVLATAFSEEPARSGRYLPYLFTNIFVLVLAASSRTWGQICTIAGCLMFLGWVHLLAVLISRASLGATTPEAIMAYQPFVTLLVPNDALIIGLCIPAYAMFMQRPSRRWFIATVTLLTIYSLLAVFASVLLQSKVTFLSVITGLVAMVIGWRAGFHKGKSLHQIVRPGITIVTALILLLLATWYLGNQSTTRLGLWSYAVSKTAASQVLVGSGPNTFSYDPTQVETKFEEGDMVIPWVHNLFLEAYTEQGVIGLIAILAMTIVPLAKAIRIRAPDFRTFIFASALIFIFLSLVEITLTRRFNFAYLALTYGMACSPAVQKYSGN